MTEMPSCLIKNPKFEPKKQCYYSSSLLYILLSIFTYILIFYVFELSPSSIFKDTKVLFFISNTLILIIAADYGAFTHKETHDFYDEYAVAAKAMRSRAYNYSSIPVLTYQEIPSQQNSGDAEIKNPRDAEIKNPRDAEIKKTIDAEIKNPRGAEIKNPRGTEIKNPDEEEPMVKEIVCVSSPPEKIVRVVSEEKPRDHVAIEKYKPVTKQTAAANKEEACNARNHVNPKSYGRTKSEKPRRMKISEETKAKRKSYQQSESDSLKWMVKAEKWENVEEESEEFSKMSNEELNRRVEDFIQRQRFNTQIRLQSRVSST